MLISKTNGSNFLSQSKLLPYFMNILSHSVKDWVQSSWEFITNLQFLLQWRKNSQPSSKSLNFPDDINIQRHLTCCEQGLSIQDFWVFKGLKFFIWSYFASTNEWALKHFKVLQFSWCHYCSDGQFWESETVILFQGWSSGILCIADIRRQCLRLFQAKTIYCNST
jgi:hypothetical protein